ncbi:hypothetical protein AB0F17_59810 [Nonomuraea sp. NPDC026600]|uniref:hypothetical protein n=1 Tax=Nonomuraea sp. NPDC026600 TaxID=3155363 RepID=UPI0033F9B8E1
MGELDGCVDDTPMPAWAGDYLTAKQQNLSPVMRWVTLAYQRIGWEPSHVTVVQRLCLSVMLKAKGQPLLDWRSEGQLAQDLKLSRNTVGTVLKDLECEGWISQRVRAGGSGRKERWPTWPPIDCLTPADGPELCAAPTKAGMLCIRRAGWGTPTPGAGPCKLHRADGHDAQDEQHEQGGAQPLSSSADPGTCPMVEQGPAQPLGTDLLNGCEEVPNGWAAGRDKEGGRESHQSVSAPAPPPEVEPEVPRPRTATDELEDRYEINEAVVGSGTERPDDATGSPADPGPAPQPGQAVQILQELYPCSPADAEAMVTLIGQGKAITDWRRYLSAWTPDSWARWHARVRSTPLPPPARERITYQPPRDPRDPDDVVDDVLPVDETLARLREQMGWTPPTRTPT